MGNIALLVLGVVLLFVAIGMGASKRNADRQFEFMQREQRYESERQDRALQQQFPEGIAQALSDALAEAMLLSSQGDIEGESEETNRVFEAFSAEIANFKQLAHKGYNYQLANALQELQDGERLCVGSKSILGISTTSEDCDRVELRTDRLLVDFKGYRLSANTKAEVFSDGHKQVNYTTAAGPGATLYDALANPEIIRHLDDDRSFVLSISDPAWQVFIRSEVDPEYSQFGDNESDLEDFRRLASMLNQHVKANFKQKKQKKSEKSEPTTAEKLVEISKLLDRGLISQQEFESLKQDLLKKPS